MPGKVDILERTPAELAGCTGISDVGGDFFEIDIEPVRVGNATASALLTD